MRRVSACRLQVVSCPPTITHIPDCASARVVPPASTGRIRGYLVDFSRWWGTARLRGRGACKARRTAGTHGAITALPLPAALSTPPRHVPRQGNRTAPAACLTLDERFVPPWDPAQARPLTRSEKVPRTRRRAAFPKVSIVRLTAARLPPPEVPAVQRRLAPVKDDQSLHAGAARTARAAGVARFPSC
jgi:hypothetical protein